MWRVLLQKFWEDSKVFKKNLQILWKLEDNFKKFWRTFKILAGELKKMFEKLKGTFKNSLLLGIKKKKNWVCK